VVALDAAERVQPITVFNAFVWQATWLCVTMPGQQRRVCYDQLQVVVFARTSSNHNAFQLSWTVACAW
jgi:hypothetical protein